jgi:hypothetical protein
MSSQSSARRGTRITVLLIAASVGLSADAGAIPAFARRYNQSCNLCHSPIPRLTETGEMVASHGFRMAPGEVSPDAMNGGDELLSLPKTLPLAIRIDGQFRVYGDRNDTPTDFESPWVMKILSSAPIGRSLSYYFYFLLNERGEVAGAEDAFLYWNDLGGAPIDIAAGQFQVSDPLFKRELRLPVDDYMVYKVRIADQPAALAYERGLMLMMEPAGVTTTIEIVNGNGLPGASDGRFDGDPEKNLFGHVSRDLGSFLRLGALGYYGMQRRAGGPANKLWMGGADATLTMGTVELNLQYVHREDTRPTFTAGERMEVMDGGFAEILLLPGDARWYGYALYNRVEDNRALLEFGDGAPAGVRLYETVAAGWGYLVQRNARVFVEALYDTQQETSRGTVGFSLAY